MAEPDGLAARLGVFLRLFGGVAGSVHLVRGNDLHLAADERLPEPLRAAVAVIPRGKGMAGTAWARGVPIQTCDLETDDGGVVRPGARAVNAHAAVALPVRGTDEAVAGVVGIAFDEEREFSPADISSLMKGAARVLFGADEGGQPLDAPLAEAAR
jgi:L-methionine (R)-S-oxide reductase